MKIASIALYTQDINYAHGEYVMSGGRAATSQSSTLIGITTDTDLIGWGECTPLGGTYLPTFHGSVRAALAEISPHLLGADPTNIRAIRARMDQLLRGQEGAKSAVDIACWDLFGKSLQTSISRLLGGVLLPDFPLYEAVPLAEPASMQDFVRQRTAAGIRAFQLKVGNEPDTDIARIEAVLEVADDDVIVIADANGGWSPDAAWTVSMGLRSPRVYIEQPCQDLQDSAQIGRLDRHRLILDEVVTDARSLYAAKQAGAVGVNLKLSRLGGITPTVRLRDLAHDLGMRVSIEDCWGGDVVTAAVSHIAATTTPNTFLTASFFNDWTDGHPAGHQPRSRNGRGAAPTAPGLGIEIDTSALTLFAQFN